MGRLPWEDGEVSIMWPFKRRRRNLLPPPARVARPRSLPGAFHYQFCLVLCAINYLCIIALVTTSVMTLLHAHQRAIHLLILTSAATLATWFLAYFKRRKTLCPLCKGTPLMESGARLHIRAKRIFPFSHGVSTVLFILFTQKFRCMYCGTDFDLLKDSKRHHPQRPSRSTRRLPFFKRKG